MKSTKYQLLKSEFDSLVKNIRLYRERIEELEKENKAMKSIIEVDRHEYGELFERYKKVKEENEYLKDDLAIAKGEA